MAGVSEVEVGEIQAFPRVLTMCLRSDQGRDGQDLTSQHRACQALRITAVGLGSGGTRFRAETDWRPAATRACSTTPSDGTAGAG